MKDEQTLIDEFAKAAMNGMLSADHDDASCHDKIAELAYKMAMRMVRERRKTLDAQRQSRGIGR